MLNLKQMKEIKEHLEKAQNPVFFFDNDVDGLCSFLLLQRYIGRGKGVPIKSFPNLSVNYFKKIDELNADYVFILDKAEVSKEFFEEVHQINIPVIWIDHHKTNTKIPEFVFYYNPLLNEEKFNEPVTYLCYKITNKKEDLWIATIGCIADSFFPDFYSNFSKEYLDLTIDSENVFDIYYKSQAGKIAQILDAGLKDRTTNVINMLRFLMKVKTPYEILNENSKNHSIYKRFKYIDSKKKKLIEKAKSIENEKDFLFFQYRGDLSISSSLAGELKYLFPKKIVVVAYLVGAKANISVRGKSIRKKVLKAIEGLEGATGGGHEDAVGAKVKVEDLDEFRKRLENLVE
jgi:single-stranded DNA-specific DHH superfamily exonuclease